IQALQQALAGINPGATQYRLPCTLTLQELLRIAEAGAGQAVLHPLPGFWSNTDQKAWRVAGKPYGRPGMPGQPAHGPAIAVARASAANYAPWGRWVSFRRRRRARIRQGARARRSKADRGSRRCLTPRLWPLWPASWYSLRAGPTAALWRPPSTSHCRAGRQT